MSWLRSRSEGARPPSEGRPKPHRRLSCHGRRHHDVLTNRAYARIPDVASALDAAGRRLSPHLAVPASDSPGRQTT